VEGLKRQNRKNHKKKEKKREEIKGYPNPLTWQSHIFNIEPSNWTPSL
jgi:hypothetical protein